MKTYGVGWLGLYREESSALRHFIATALGGRLTHEGEDFWVFMFDGGDQLEIFGPHGPEPPHLFAEGDTVAGFLVDDLEAAKAKVVSEGSELLGPTQRVGTYAWQHFRGPDGRVYELVADPGRKPPSRSDS